MKDPSSSGTLRVGILAPLRSLDPTAAGDLMTALAISQVFETPLRLGEPGEPPEPVLFASVPEAEDEGRTWSAPVREGIEFSDGTPLDAPRMARALRRTESLGGRVEIEARGSVVVFHLKEPNPRFDLHLTFEDCAVALETATGELRGTGPYMAESRPNARGLRLARNPRYRGPVGPEAVEFRVYPPDEDGHPEALLEALENGEIDFTNMLSKQDVASVTGYKKLLRPSMSLATLSFNTRRAVLEDPRRRRAIACALDRRELTGISHTNVVAFCATSVLPPSIGIADDGLSHDLGRARALLEEAGAPGPLEMLLVWAPRPYLPHPQPVADKLVEQLAAVGVEVRAVRPADADDFFERQRTGEYDLILGGWISDLPDPAELLTALFSEERIPTPSSHGIASGNLSRWSDPRTEEALERLRRTGSEEDRDVVLGRVAEEVPVVPLMYGSTVVVHAWRVRNVELSMYGTVDFADVELDD